MPYFVTKNIEKQQQYDLSTPDPPGTILSRCQGVTDVAHISNDRILEASHPLPIASDFAAPELYLRIFPLCRMDVV
ncbi:hypothetical protein KIN20_030533 [Parelaphostrongylus tenuis]|uniref:Uncharacterized protein n=1 Tax=Parelaphostrongylus tenuis TaxID=148309 RepID=A0AAD5R3U6_PARTN|nr:hypothetical protein KIN20_030533 [Parelaphostrongylus tenuis]